MVRGIGGFHPLDLTFLTENVFRDIHFGRAKAFTQVLIGNRPNCGVLLLIVNFSMMQVGIITFLNYFSILLLLNPRWHL